MTVASNDCSRLTSTTRRTATDSYLTGTQALEDRAGVSSESNGTASALTYYSPVYVNAPLARDRDGDSKHTDLNAWDRHIMNRLLQIGRQSSKLFECRRQTVQRHTELVCHS